jgi:hypothetical protein
MMLKKILQKACKQTRWNQRTSKATRDIKVKQKFQAINGAIFFKCRIYGVIRNRYGEELASTTTFMKTCNQQRRRKFQMEQTFKLRVK